MNIDESFTLNGRHNDDSSLWLRQIFTRLGCSTDVAPQIRLRRTGISVAETESTDTLKTRVLGVKGVVEAQTEPDGLCPKRSDERNG